MGSTLAVLVSALIGLALLVHRRLLNHAQHAHSTSNTGATNGHVAHKEMPKSRTVAESSFTASYVMHPANADGTGKVYSGELLKLIDIVAGIASRKHAGTTTVTISVDRVILLSPISVGDIVHMSVSINRAWGTSMEAGVRVMREDANTGNHAYACHAYLTFVARPPPSPLPPAPSVLTSLSHLLLPSPAPSPQRAQVPSVQPVTLLERKRHLLAGRRRGQRMRRREEWDRLLSTFRAYVLSLPVFPAGGTSDEEKANSGGDDKLEELQMEMVAEAWVKKDEDVRVEGDLVIAEMPGYMDRISFPLKDIEKFVHARGTGAFRRLSVPRSFSIDRSPSLRSPGSRLRSVSELQTSPRTIMLGASDLATEEPWMQLEQTLEMRDTVATATQIVRPQHCNSLGVLFGGELMRWLEEVAALSARRLAPAIFSTVTVDSMTFRASAHPGYVVSLRAVVLKVWESSLECYCVATAIDRAGNDIFCSDAFFSLVAIDPDSRRPKRGGLRHLRLPGAPDTTEPIEEEDEGGEGGDERAREKREKGLSEGEKAARAVIAQAGGRRDQRLADKRVLLRVYS